jgi:hypothetical protein
MAALSGVRETSMARNNATNIALQLGVASLQIVLIWRCSSYCCGAVSCDTAALQVARWRRCSLRACVAAALQLAWLTMLRHYNSHCCGVAAL